MRRSSNGSDISSSISAEMYLGGKWGRYLRAPDLYFDIMRDYGSRFVRLAEIAEIRRGITSGCDAFFMPHDVTASTLDEYRTEKDFRRRFGIGRTAVERDEYKIVEAGDGSLHAIEAIYVRPEVHSLMEVDRPLVRGRDLDRVVVRDAPDHPHGLQPEPQPSSVQPPGRLPGARKCRHRGLPAVG